MCVFLESSGEFSYNEAKSLAKGHLSLPRSSHNNLEDVNNGTSQAFLISVFSSPTQKH